jgi:peptidyl-prolyl cis-trans isomerase D
MALIGKIRKNSWILVVMVGLGLGGFILMDMTSSQNMGGGPTTMAEINGQKVDINEFSNKERVVYGNSGGDTYARRAALWDFYVEKSVVSDEADAIGLGVSKDELRDLQFGSNLSPIITSRFRDPATNQVDRNRLTQFQQAIDDNSLDPTLRPFWAHQEEEIITERLKQKINNMAAKGLYVPGWLAERLGNESNEKITFNYVRVPFDLIENTDVALSDEDYKNYLKEHLDEYKVDEEVRKLAYVTFPVVASSQDSAAIREEVAGLVEDFRTAEDDSLFVQSNYGTIDGSYLSKDQLEPAIADTMFSVAIGTVYGPYLSNDGSYKAVKLQDRRAVADSVKSRHILLRVNNQNPLEFQQAYQTVDSLKNLIENGVATFDTLAREFGQDGTAAQGGDLGFAAAGQMVKPFNDLIFYQAEIGELNIVATQFGVHLVEVTDKKYINNEVGVKVAYVSRKIIPSEETQGKVEEMAMDFADANTTVDAMKAAAEGNPELTYSLSAGLKRNDYLIGTLGSGNGTSRELVRWAFGDEQGYEEPVVGEACPDVFAYQKDQEVYTDKFVVVGLNSVQEPGTPSLEEVRSDIEPAVITEKKAELIKQRMNGKTSLPAIAQEFGVQVDTAANVAFSAGFIPNVGNEGKVVARAFGVDLNQLSEPIVGNSGVFILIPTLKPAAGAPNLAAIRSSHLATLRSQVQSRLINSLKDNADVDDMRSRFY